MKKLLLTAATGCYIAQSCLAGDFSMNNNQNTIWKIEKSAITLTPGGKWQDHFAMSGRSNWPQMTRPKPLRFTSPWAFT